MLLRHLIASITKWLLLLKCASITHQSSGLGVPQWCNVACWSPLPEKSPPVGSPSPFGAPSLNLNQLDDFTGYTGKISKKVCF